MNTLVAAAVLAVTVLGAQASVCVVSFWSPWGPCIGNCQFGLAARNRDVMRPPFPERTDDGRLAIRACPPLYQVQTCVPTPCLQGLENFAGISLTSPIKSAPVDSNSVDVNTLRGIPADVVTIGPSVAVPIIDDNQLDTDNSLDEPSVYDQKIQELPEERELAPPEPLFELKTTEEPISSGDADDEETTEPAPIVGVTETLGNGMVLHEDMSREESKAVHLELPSSRQPGNATTSVSSSAETTDSSTGANSTSAEFEKSAVLDGSELLGVRLSDDGRVLKSRAIKVPDPDYNNPGSACTSDGVDGITGGTGPDGNRCCRRPMRILCPDGRRPQIVMRYYRNVDQEECTSYSYPYCGYESEQLEKPIKWEEDCYHMCFTDNEKQSMDVFKTIRFDQGFRSDFWNQTSTVPSI